MVTDEGAYLSYLTLRFCGDESYATLWLEDHRGDCDDTDASRHPDTVEVVGDGIDSNCDGDPDT